MGRTEYELAPQEREEGNNKGTMAGALMERKKLLIPLVITIIILLVVAVVLVVLFIGGGQPQHKGFDAILQDKKICFDPKNVSSYEKYTDVFNKMIEPYEKAEIKGNMINCNDRPPNTNEVCFLKDSWLNSCNKNAHWGFKDSKPCYIVTLDKYRDFNPEPYKSSDGLPDDIPVFIKQYMKEDEEEGNSIALVPVTCSHAETYNPLPGVKGNFLILSNSTEYLQPLIAISFDLTKIDHLDVECTLWSNTSVVNPFPKISFQISKNC